MGNQVVRMDSRAAFRPQFTRIAAERIRAARARNGTPPDQYAEELSRLTGRDVTEAKLREYEKSGIFPADVLLAAAADEDSLLPAVHDSFSAVPAAFAPAQLAGNWVTAYEFTHAGTPHHHADIAHVTVSPGGQVRAVNHPPEPRTEGRTRPFRNEISARLAGRHLIGTWRNTSDARYFGSVHLAVWAGETSMDGWYTGLASDVEVSLNRWKWIRLDTGEISPEDLSRVVLRDPAAVYEAVAVHPFDAPIGLNDIGETA